VFSIGWGFALLRFSGFCALIGLLILHSRLIPHAVGALMIAAGASYFTNSLADILAPNVAAGLQPWILCLVCRRTLAGPLAHAEVGQGASEYVALISWLRKSSRTTRKLQTCRRISSSNVSERPVSIAAEGEMPTCA
jgi:hypothetical protein